MPPSDTGALIRALVGDALPESLVTTIAERSDGNPLFIEELIRTWVSVGTLVREGDRWTLAVAPDAVALPSTVQAIYAAQLDDLPPDARQVARRASVIGRRFAQAALDPLQLAHTEEGLEGLRHRAFIDGPHADAVSGRVYAYRHALLRDAGYASLARAEANSLARSVGAPWWRLQALEVCGRPAEAAAVAAELGISGGRGSSRAPAPPPGG